MNEASSAFSDLPNIMDAVKQKKKDLTKKTRTHPLVYKHQDKGLRAKAYIYVETNKRSLQHTQDKA